VAASHRVWSHLVHILLTVLLTVGAALPKTPPQRQTARPLGKAWSKEPAGCPADKIEVERMCSEKLTKGRWEIYRVDTQVHGHAARYTPRCATISARPAPRASPAASQAASERLACAARVLGPKPAAGNRGSAQRGCGISSSRRLAGARCAAGHQPSWKPIVASPLRPGRLKVPEANKE
jgi:hypothetical protein